MDDLRGIQVHVLDGGRATDLRVKDEAETILGINSPRDGDCEIRFWVDILWRLWSLQVFKWHFYDIVLIFDGDGGQHWCLGEMDEE